MENGHPRLPPPVTTTVSSTTTTTTHGTRTVTTSHTSPGRGIAVTSSTPQSITATHPTVTTTHQTPFYRLSPPPAASVATQTEQRAPSIRIRRQAADQGIQVPAVVNTRNGTTRVRSSSDPQPPRLATCLEDGDLEMRKHVTATPMQTLQEEGYTTATEPLVPVEPLVPTRSARRPAVRRQFSLNSFRSRREDVDQEPVVEQPLYDARMIDMLDVIDPEVATLTTLNNLQNSLFIPNLGWLYRRQPTYNLSQLSPNTSDEENRIGVGSGNMENTQQSGDGIEEQARDKEMSGATRPDINRLETTNTISSVLTSTSEGHNYAVLPHGASLPGWTAEDKAALNDHVRHLLHSRRAKFKRGMRGFGRYIRKPVGFLVSLYAFLLTFWGAAWVLFLIGWISVQGRQAYFIEICDQILTALFCVVGIGLAPWRAVDTYHMIYIAHYAHLTWRLRKERGLPALDDHNELPARPTSHIWETGDLDPPAHMEEIVLTAAQQRNLEHHQAKFANSHSFYKPHETSTHSAFSLRLLIAIVVLLDCHSLFQMALGGTTWGIYYKVRPKALTAVILTCSISCNISAGITITIGDKRSRKKLVVEQMFRQEVTEDALEDLRKERGLEARGVKTEEEKKEGEQKEKEKEKREKKEKKEKKKKEKKQKKKT
ncbi:hypothetical protein K504DRAFT_415263 [Pleomassaria siparia CBS 279.74]|uniref:Integral membrane protein n=1 Tax=Pleomassaria siparia CBS 279.74 TaxID=1314801 RepID=A0A6G1JZ19_9PLEO|nr:hypothetical protein K504DRAFT_415263 [Pleomassaria siparia CBS 279.74]